MRVLLDENLDPRFRKLLPDHDCVTASYAGWDGMKNGTLLAAAEAAGFEVFLTGDTKIPEEQNINGRSIGVVVMTAHHLSIIRDRMPEILRRLQRQSLELSESWSAGSFGDHYGF